MPRKDGKLQEILRKRGISTLREFADKTGLSRQHAWNLWHGYVGVGKAIAVRLNNTLGIPFEDLMQVDSVPDPRRRPPKTQPGEAKEERQQEG